MISVIIPVYNVEQYVGAALRSVLDQSYKDVEVIVVDDCGMDASMAVVEQLAAGNPCVRILHHDHNRGLSAARNTGMAVAGGEYVFFLDSDDKLTPDCLAKLHAKARETDADVTMGSYETFGGENKKYVADDTPFVTAWNKLCKRAFLQDHGIRFVEGLIHEDCPWSFEVECKGATFAYVTDITYLYLVREGSLQTGKDYSKHFEAYMRILQIYADVMAATGCADRYVHWLERQKALWFGMTMEAGTPGQCRQMYALIRSLKPHLHENKADWHYLVPACLGYPMYRRFFRYHLC